MYIHSDKFSDNELENNVTKQQDEIIGLYPKGGLMNIHSDKFSDNELENDVTKQRNPTTEKKKGEIEEVTVGKRNMDRETLRMVREEVTRIQLENRNRETSLGKERKTIMGGEEKIVFFSTVETTAGGSRRRLRRRRTTVHDG